LGVQGGAAESFMQPAVVIRRDVQANIENNFFIVFVLNPVSKDPKRVFSAANDQQFLLFNS
jgi:hypothetical protein